MLDRRFMGSFVARTLAVSVAAFAGSAMAFEIQTYPDYPSQLEPLQAKVGDGIFVAKFLAILVDDRAATFAVWTDGVPTALPKTDYVLVQSQDYTKKFFIPWAMLQSEVAQMKIMADTNPPRYLTPGRMPAGFLASVERDYRVPKGFPDFSK